MSTRETKQSSFLFRYGAALVVCTEIFMSATIMVLYSTNGSYIPTCIMLFLSPLLGGIIAGKVSKTTKKVLFRENIKKYFLIVSIILYIFIYLMNFRFNVILAGIYGIGSVIGFFGARKSIQKLIEEMRRKNLETEVFTKGEKITITEYTLGRTY